MKEMNKLGCAISAAFFAWCMLMFLICNWLVHGMYNLIKSDPYRKLVEQKKDELKSLINHGATDATIGAELGMTVGRVKYWIKEWNLGRRKHIIATGRFR